MYRRFNSNTKSITCTLLFSLLLMMNVGAVLSSEMMMQDGTMHHCPFMGVVSLCNMSPIAHMAQWQQMFATTVHGFATTALLLLLSLVIVFSFVNFFLKTRRAPVRLVSRYRYKERVFDPFRLALARGILNPKLY